MKRLPFLHENEEFPALLSIVSAERGVSEALVEKDYWITHTLWALQEAGLELYFKGGTSLSKGFGLIERFSEDLDLKITAPGLPAVANWRSKGVRATREREAYFCALEEQLHMAVEGVEELANLRDDVWRSATFAIHYPSRARGALPEGMRPFVQVEVGSARVTPGEVRPISSWIHDHLVNETPDLSTGFRGHQPQGIHCVLPAVTLVEKIEAIARRFPRDPFDPAHFVRHYEDVARILLRWDLVGPAELSRLLTEMRNEGDIRKWPPEDHPAFNPEAASSRWVELERTWTVIGPLFWGDRIPLTECAQKIRDFLATLE